MSREVAGMRYRKKEAAERPRGRWNVVMHKQPRETRNMSVLEGHSSCPEHSSVPGLDLLRTHVRKTYEPLSSFRKEIAGAHNLLKENPSSLLMLLGWNPATMAPT
jgi:hypothetical protein